jgi:hypothetical protein
MKKVWFKDPAWWDAALDRSFKAAAQVLILAIVADQLGWFSHWYQILISGGTAALLSLLNSVLMDPRDGGTLRLFRPAKDPK